MRFSKTAFLLFAFSLLYGCSHEQSPQQYDRYDYDDYMGITPKPTQPTESSDKRSDLLVVHNEYRSQVPATKWKPAPGPLKMDRRLEDAAQRHAEWMALHNNLSHEGENESHVNNRVNGSFRAVGENIAYGYRTVNDVFPEWVKSPGHERNISNSSFSHMGIGIAYSKDGTLFWCVVFGG